MYRADAENLIEKLATKLNASNLTVENLSDAMDNATTNCVNLSGIEHIRSALGDKSLRTIPSRTPIQDWNANLAQGSDDLLVHLEVSEDMTRFEADMTMVLCQTCESAARTTTGNRGITDEEKISGTKTPVPIDVAYSSDGAKLDETSGTTFL